MKLIATRDVLYRGKCYEAGEMLPADDERMVGAWVNCGSARWEGKPDMPETKKKGKK